MVLKFMRAAMEHRASKTAKAGSRMAISKSEQAIVFIGEID
jgi:hypothetical protein